MSFSLSLPICFFHFLTLNLECHQCKHQETKCALWHLIEKRHNWSGCKLESVQLNADLARSFAMRSPPLLIVMVHPHLIHFCKKKLRHYLLTNLVAAVGQMHILAVFCLQNCDLLIQKVGTTFLKIPAGCIPSNSIFVIFIRFHTYCIVFYKYGSFHEVDCYFEFLFHSLFKLVQTF